jgi:hypothetical protein
LKHKFAAGAVWKHKFAECAKLDENALQKPSENVDFMCENQAGQNPKIMARSLCPVLTSISVESEEEKSRRKSPVDPYDSHWELQKWILLLF